MHEVVLMTDALRSKYARIHAADGGECDLVLGSVLGASGVIPCPALVERLLAIVQSAKGAVLMEINNG